MLVRTANTQVWNRRCVIMLRTALAASDHITDFHGIHIKNGLDVDGIEA